MSSQQKSLPKKRGRKPDPDKMLTLAVKLSPADIERVQAYATHHAINRSEALRRLIRDGLD